MVPAPRSYAEIVASDPPSRAPTYAEIVARRPARAPPPAAAAAPPLLGRPRAVLPVSQLSLGRTTPPWNGAAWLVDHCRVAGGGEVLAVDLSRGAGARFLASPRGLPATDVTLSYTARFASDFAWSRGGTLPGLQVGREAACALAWLPRGQLVARDGIGRELLRDADLRLRRGRWNTLVLRVRLNGFEDGRAARDGVLAVCVNGAVASVQGLVWRRDARSRVTHAVVQCRCRGCPDGAAVEFGDFALTT